MKNEPIFKKKYVGSGQYWVSSKKREILEAILGTCVAVTLCDRRAHVGGLIHLLLAEPSDVDNTWEPWRYARTGLPLFIEAMSEAGARKECLEAHIAGGALIGPLSTKDLDLDVGGRTVEVVETILKKENIPIISAETGGFFSRRLNINLWTLESSNEPLDTPERTSGAGSIERKPETWDIDQAIKRVRPIPQIVLKIIRMIRNASISLKDISEELRKDQVLSAKVIRLCNTAFFSIGQEIDAIDRALVFLGEKQFLQLIISSSMEDIFPESDKGYSLCKGGIYKHALGTALVSEILAEFAGNVPSDIAYTAGLLHDIGKVVLDQIMASAYPLFYRRTQEEGMKLTAVEREEFGIDHSEAGGRLGEEWSLPEILIDAIRHHHNPEAATVDPRLSHVVYLADLIMSLFFAGLELERLNTHELAMRLEAVGIRPDQFANVINRIPDRIFHDALSVP
jgi:putative nucleotidyltransferase with HDIG domain